MNITIPDARQITTIHDRDVHVVRRGDTFEVDLQYPPASCGQVDPTRVSYVCFDQTSVRASGGIRISFSYVRNGYLIEQPTKFEWADDEDSSDNSYVEVAFIPAFHEAVDA